MRLNKHMLFGGMGFLGGIGGALAAELLPELSLGSALLRIGHMGVWGAIFSTGITVGLICALEFYSGRRRPSSARLKSGLLTGVLAGGLASGIAQAVFTLHRFAGAGQFFFQSGCWGLAGGLLGWRLSYAVPNLGAGRGALAGFVGGFVGGMGFLLVAFVLPAAVGRMFGIGILGAALGLTLVVVEEMFRNASLEVIWAPRETTVLSLGVRPISIGGGDDHVHIAGLPEHAAMVTLQEGRIFYIDTANGARTEFRDGSRIKVGRIDMIVHAKRS